VSAVPAAENLVPYLTVQCVTVATVLLIAAACPSPYPQANRIYLALALYGIAKIAQHKDAVLFSLGRIVFGHRIKHLAAACAAWQILRMLQARWRASGAGCGPVVPVVLRTLGRASRVMRAL